MPFTITARFPLGYYQGRNPAGQVEEVPTPVRLLSALTAAAGLSHLADFSNGASRIAQRSHDALEWLSNNPPDQISLPQRILNEPGITAYRKLGLRAKKGFDVPTAKAAIARTSLAGPVHWRWLAVPPEPVADTLMALAAEVPYLGEAESLVILDASLDDFDIPDPLERRDAIASKAWSAAAELVSVPAAGRLEVLERQHKHLTRKSPSNDSSQEEKENLAPWPDQAIRQVWYESQADFTVAGGPWREAFVIELHDSGTGSAWPPPQRDYVRWAVALHRLLVRIIGQDAPPLITGHYAPGSDRPANRVSVQVLINTDPLKLPLRDSSAVALAVLIPNEATDSERGLIYRTIAALAGRTIRPSRDAAAQVSAIRFAEASEFWASPAPGSKRFWATRPLAITDTRPLKRNAAGAPWSLVDAVMLSIGMVWRSTMAGNGTGEDLYRALSDAAAAQARVISLQRVHDSGLYRYVHRTRPNTIVTGYRALLDLDQLLPGSAPAALGQSRHLGGGLLVPVDIPESLLDEDGRPAWN